jgi:nucleoside-diphosphate-sugar epimerase
MKALITGGGGFIGGLLIERLLAGKHQVRVLVRTGSRSIDLSRLPIELSIGDIRDGEILKQACDGIDVVFHTAARAIHWGPKEAFQATNVTGTRRVVEAMAAAGAGRLVHFSSFVVYGNRCGEIREDAPCMKSGDLYSDSKIDGESVAREIAARHGIALTILRPGVVYGPKDPKWIPMVSRNVLSGRMRVIGSGEAIAPVIYGKDVVEFAVQCSVHPNAVGETFNIVGTEAVSWRQFLEALAANLDVPFPRIGIPFHIIYPIAACLEVLWTLAGSSSAPPATRFGLRLLASDRRYDMGKARRTLGFEPKVSHVEGLKATVDWMRKAQVLT